jgi:GcrA cell cycle regulator
MMFDTWWTDERVTQLKTRNAQGATAAVIGAEFGKTRNAILGKLNRLGLCTPNPDRKLHAHMREYRSKRSNLPPEPHQKRLNDHPRAETIVRHRALRESIMQSCDLPDETIPVEQRKQIIDLKPGNCRWPCGDPQKHGFFFCGGKAIKGFPYCVFHIRVAYVAYVVRS